MTTEGNGGEPAKAEAPAGQAAASAPDTGGIGVVLYKLALAGVGAVLLAQEELETAWKKRAAGDTGDGAEAPKGEQPEEEKSHAVEAAAAVATKAQIDGTIGRALRSLSIPTRDDVELMSKRIDAIAARMDALGL